MMAAPPPDAVSHSLGSLPPLPRHEKPIAKIQRGDVLLEGRIGRELVSSVLPLLQAVEGVPKRCICRDDPGSERHPLHGLASTGDDVLLELPISRTTRDDDHESVVAPECCGGRSRVPGIHLARHRDNERAARSQRHDRKKPESFEPSAKSDSTR